MHSEIECMNRFLVVDVVRLNAINRFALTGAVREGIVAAGMQVFQPSAAVNNGLEIMKVDLVANGTNQREHYLAVLLRLDDVVALNLDSRELWIGKEICCGVVG